MPTPLPPAPADTVQSAAVVASPPVKAALTPMDQNVHLAAKQLHTLNSAKYTASLVTLRRASGFQRKVMTTLQAGPLLFCFVEIG